MTKLQSRKQILLTGAGFSKNFGGFLAHQMTDVICNLLGDHPNLKSFLIEIGDYESFYSQVITGDKFSPEDKDLVTKVIEGAYKNLDEKTKMVMLDSENPIQEWGEFMSSNFNGDASGNGCFFTLNQDLILERTYNFVCPGIPSFRKNLGQTESFSSQHYIKLPQDTDRAERDIPTLNLSYFKLHGSFGWKSSDDKNMMVVGKNKSELIEKEPILKLYLNIFKDVITEGDKKILIIGYGFMDDHINEILLDGVNNHGLKMIVIGGHSSIVEFTKKIKTGHTSALTLVEKIYKYYPHTLKEILTGKPWDSSLRSEIEESLR